MLESKKTVPENNQANTQLYPEILLIKSLNQSLLAKRFYKQRNANKIRSKYSTSQNITKFPNSIQQSNNHESQKNLNQQKYGDKQSQHANLSNEKAGIKKLKNKSSCISQQKIQQNNSSSPQRVMANSFYTYKHKNGNKKICNKVEQVQLQKTCLNDSIKKINSKTQTKYSDSFKEVSRKGKWLKVIAKYKNLHSKANDEIQRLMCIEQIKISHHSTPIDCKFDSFNLTLKEKLYTNHLSNLINRTVSDKDNSKQSKLQQCNQRFTINPHMRTHSSNQSRNCSSVLISTNNYELLTQNTKQIDAKRKFRSKKTDFVAKKNQGQKQGPEQQFMIRKPILRKDYFVFGLNNRITPECKLEYFRDFLWKISYSNGIHVDTPKELLSPYKYYIGQGNNSVQIRNVMRKRFWWSIIEKSSDQKHTNWKNANLVWTQLKINQLFQIQPCNQKQTAVSDQQKPNQTDDSKLQTIYLGNSQMQSADCQYHNKIFKGKDLELWNQHYAKNKKVQNAITEKTYIKRLNLIKSKPIKRQKNSESLIIHNHLCSNYFIGNKKALFYNMRKYLQLKDVDPFSILPLTFHIIKGVDDPEYLKFKDTYMKIEQMKNQATVIVNNIGQQITKKLRNVWIVKPGQNTNRGKGITICYSIDDILLRLRGKQKNSDGQLRTFIIQKYIQNPFLYNKRKIDIRHYLLITCINGNYKAYWYQEGYIRTSSTQFSIRCSKDPFVHLTNDSIQKTGQNYGKFQKGNKLGYHDFQKYLYKTRKDGKNNFYTDILPQMKRIGTEAVRSCYSLLDTQRKTHNFELLGLDFMIDDDLRPWLIQVNTNPCLETSCPLLERMIPQLLENVFRIAVDPLFPPPQSWQSGKKMCFGQNPLIDNKFQIVFDEQYQGTQIEKIYQGTSKIDQKMGVIEQDEEIYDQEKSSQIIFQKTIE